MLTPTHEMLILKHATMMNGYKPLTIKEGLQAIVKVSSPITTHQIKKELKC